jgi:capsular polysaccharide export protein
VRAVRPEAFVAYKPHPDIEAGYRKGVVPSDALGRLCDLVVPAASILSLIDWADEVHTLTSLAGFEALLRGKRVVVYGQPFYAGWGLTDDRAPLPRRQRRLSLDELVAGAPILYPRYIDPLTRLPCSPEILIDRLSARHLWRGTRLTPLRRLQGMLFGRAKALAALCAPKRQL